MFVVYEVLLYLVFAISLPFFLLAGFMRGKYLTNFWPRMGFYKHAAEPHDIWIHAVSVGEVLAAREVVREIRKVRPELSFVFTTTTVTGQTQARRLFPEATVTYFPFDFSASVKRFLNHHRPRLFATMETEIWPNVTRLARKRGMHLVLANGRISDRSLPRYQMVRFAVARVLANYDAILAREENDRARFIAIGADEEKVRTTGNVKFDFEPDHSPLDSAPLIESLIAGRKVVVLGSTMEGEDEEFLPEIERFVREHRAFVILAPRKPERFEQVAGLLTTTSLRYVRRSEIDDGAALDQTSVPDVLLLDTLGELSRVYHYATAAFVGGSIAPFGGHNPIEPAAAGVPVCFGPSMSNFREIAQTFLAGGGAVEVATAAEAIAFAERMIEDEAARAAMGERARATVLANRGASQRTAACIVGLLP